MYTSPTWVLFDKWLELKCFSKDNIEIRWLHSMNQWLTYTFWNYTLKAAIIAIVEEQTNAEELDSPDPKSMEKDVTMTDSIVQLNT